jgi:hypothetical protein
MVMILARAIKKLTRSQWHNPWSMKVTYWQLFLDTCNQIFTQAEIGTSNSSLRPPSNMGQHRRLFLPCWNTPSLKMTNGPRPAPFAFKIYLAIDEALRTLTYQIMHRALLNPDISEITFSEIQETGAWGIFNEILCNLPARSIRLLQIGLVGRSIRLHRLWEAGSAYIRYGLLNGQCLPPVHPWQHQKLVGQPLRTANPAQHP